MYGEKLTTKQSIYRGIYSSLEKAFDFCLELVRRRTQNFSINDQEKYKTDKFTFGFPLLPDYLIKNIKTLIYFFSMEILFLKQRRPAWRNVAAVSVG